jgi:hypothetical protein
MVSMTNVWNCAVAAGGNSRIFAGAKGTLDPVAPLAHELQIVDAVATAAARRRSMILGDVVDGALRRAIVARHAEILGNPGT